MEMFLHKDTPNLPKDALLFVIDSILLMIGASTSLLITATDQCALANLRPSKRPLIILTRIFR